MWERRKSRPASGTGRVATSVAPTRRFCGRRPADHPSAAPPGLACPDYSSDAEIGVEARGRASSAATTLRASAR